MYLVPDHLIAQYSVQNDIQFPATVDLNCPLCNHKVGLSMQWGSVNERVMTTNARCPACRKTVIFLLFDIRSRGEQGKKQGILYVYPELKLRQPIEGIDTVDEFSDALERAYISAVNVYNVGEWPAAAVLCRRLLEGITKTLLPVEKQKASLAQQLEALPEHRDLKKPVITLADAIRKGGNLGAHFDSEREPNEETVTLMLDLLEYLIEYLFILPGRINSLHEAIDNLNKKE